MLVASSVPLLSRLKESGGTFYTLSPTLNDFNTIFSGSNIKLVPSKFACLKLPKWQNTTGQRIFKDPALFGAPAVTDPNILVPKYIQDYLEVFNQYSFNNRKDTTLYNASEIGFWKMLRDAGALQLNEDSTYTHNGKVLTRFIEKPEASDYDPVVKYIGDINLLNHVSQDGQSYTEIYMHVPTDSGKIDRISFTQDDLTWNLPQFPDGGGSENAPGLDAYATTGNVKAIYDTGDRKYNVAEAIQNSIIDWDDIEGNLTDSYKKGDYDFNAIAVFYDIWNDKDQTTTARNLYGIFFIDKFIPSTGGSYELGKFQKVQPSPTAAGNSYGFRINLKFSNASNQVSSEITINDYNTISMELYMEALRKLTETNWNYQKSVTLLTSMSQRLAAVESAYGEFIPLEQTTLQLTQIREILRNMDVNNRILAPQTIFGDAPPERGVYTEMSTYWDRLNKKIYQYRNAVWVFQTDY